MLHASGTTPRRANTKPMRAAVDAMRMSMGNVMVMPKPTAGPLMAAISGFFMSKIRKVTRPPPSSCSPGTSPRATRSKVRAPPERSAPAQNARPAPVTISTRIASSPSAWSRTARSSSSMSELRAFSLSGRARVTVPTPSATSKRMVSKANGVSGAWARRPGWGRRPRPA